MGNAGNSLEGYLPMEAHSDLSALDDNGELLWSVVWLCLLGIVACFDVYFPCTSNILHDCMTIADDGLRATWVSTIPPLTAQSHDKLYYHLPLGDDKPTLYIR